MASVGPTDAGRARRSFRLSTIILLLVGLFGIGGIAYLVLSNGTSRVYVANTDLPAYHQIVQADLRLAPVDRRRVPSDGYSSEHRDALVGRYTTSAVRQDVPFRTVQLGPRLADNSLRGPVLALPVNPETSIGGRLARGDLIDILLSANGSDDGAPPPGRTIGGARVLDVIAGPNAAIIVQVTAADVTLLVAARGSSTLVVARTRAYSEP